MNPLSTLARLTFEAADDVELEAGVRALVTTGFTFRQQGRRDDLDGYLAHVRELRAAVTGVETTILDELVDRSTTPARVAARTYVRMHLTDGSVAEGEATMVGTLDSDRLSALHENGRLLAEDDDRPV